MVPPVPLGLPAPPLSPSLSFALPAGAPPSSPGLHAADPTPPRPSQPRIAAAIPPPRIPRAAVCTLLGPRGRERDWPRPPPSSLPSPLLSPPSPPPQPPPSPGGGGRRQFDHCRRHRHGEADALATTLTVCHPAGAVDLPPWPHSYICGEASCAACGQPLQLDWRLDGTICPRAATSFLAGGPTTGVHPSPPPSPPPPLATSTVPYPTPTSCLPPLSKRRPPSPTGGMGPPGLFLSFSVTKPPSGRRSGEWTGREAVACACWVCFTFESQIRKLKDQRCRSAAERNRCRAESHPPASPPSPPPAPPPPTSHPHPRSLSRAPQCHTARWPSPTGTRRRGW